MNLIKLISAVKRAPICDNELFNKEYVDDELERNIILKFNQTLENYLGVSVGNDVYYLAKNNKLKFTDTTVIKYPNQQIKVVICYNNGL